MNDSILELLEERNADEDLLFTSPICEGRPTEVANPDYDEIVLVRIRSQEVLNHKPAREKFFVAIGKDRGRKSLFSFSQRRSFCWNGFLQQVVRRMWWPINQGRKR